MKLAIYDTFERKVTAIETLIWMCLYMVGLPLFLYALAWPAIRLLDYFYPGASVFSNLFVYD